MEISPIYMHEQTMPVAIDLQETLRYMGCAKQTSGDVVMLAKRAIAALQNVIKCKACYRRTKALFFDFESIELCGIAIRSAALQKHLNGCEEAFLFAATIGIEADRLILQNKRTELSFALALQAAGSAAIESYCDYLCAEVFKKEVSTSGLYIGRRFSPGYGDLSVNYQKQIFNVLDCSKKIGLTLTDGYMMMPSKSVSAIVGIGKQEACTEGKCNICTNLNCVFRKGSDK